MQTKSLAFLALFSYLVVHYKTPNIMHKTLLALLALGGLVALPSCGVQDLTTTFAPEWVEITISLVPAYDTGSIPTKGIGEEISSTLPTQMALTLANKASGETYEVTTGTPIYMPTGTYSVVGRTAPTARQYIYGTTHYTSGEPLVVVEDELEINAATTNYSVTAGYRCFVVAVNSGEVSSWTLQTGESWPAVTKTEGAGVWWTFVIGDYDYDHPFRTMVTFADGEVLDYKFHTRDASAGGIVADFGKWYLLRQAGGTPQTGAIGLRLPEWTAGN